MKASLNQKPCEVPSGASTLADVLQYVEEERMPRGHMIFRIVLDGRELDEDSEELALDRPLGELKEVEFYSARPLDLARDGLRQATTVLPALTGSLKEAAADLRSGHVQEGVEQLYEVTSAIAWYVNLISTVEVLLLPRTADEQGGGLPPGNLTLPWDGAPLGGDDGLQDFPGDGFDDHGSATADLRTFASVENLRAKLLEVDRLQGSRDYRGLGDLLEHELLPIVRIWAREAPRLLKRVTEESGMA